MNAFNSAILISFFSEARSSFLHFEMNLKFEFQIDIASLYADSTCDDKPV